MNAVTAIVYASSTGFTARYAGMLARLSGVPAYDLSRRQELPARGSRILFMGWLCAGTIRGLAAARRRYEVAGVCAVGMAPPSAEAEAHVRQSNHWYDLPLFYLRGGYAPGRLRGIYKVMMLAMARKVTASPARTDAERAMQDAFCHGGDWVSRDALDAPLSWLRGQGEG